MWYKERKTLFIPVYVYAGWVVFAFLLREIYYALDHGLRSPYMDYIWVIPAIGLLFYVVLTLLKKDFPSLTKMLLNMSLPALWAYYVLLAVYDMASAGNDWLILFLVLGYVLLAAALVTFILSFFIKKKAENV